MKNFVKEKICDGAYYLRHRREIKARKLAEEKATKKLLLKKRAHKRAQELEMMRAQELEEFKKRASEQALMRARIKADPWLKPKKYTEGTLAPSVEEEEYNPVYDKFYR